MKCLLLSDLHYALEQLDWAAAEAATFDLVVIAGDHLDISGHVDPQTQTVVILNYFKRIRASTRLIASSGNHDLDSRNIAGEKVTWWINKAREMDVATDGDTLEIDGALVTICPWWDGPIMREQVGAQLDRDAKRPKQRWIWVYHSPPAGSPTSWAGRTDEGEAELAAWIRQFTPDIVLSGHIHESPFRTGGSWVDRIGTTWVFNSGRQPGPWPAHTVFDTNRQEAAWFSLAGAETARLDAPLQRPLQQLTALPDWLRF